MSDKVSPFQSRDRLLTGSSDKKTFNLMSVKMAGQVLPCVETVFASGATEVRHVSQRVRQTMGVDVRRGRD